MTAETLIALAGYGAALFAVCCICSLVAMAAERWPRYVKPPLMVLWLVPAGLALAPLWLFLRALDWAGNSEARRVVVGIGCMAILLALAAIADWWGF
jgi:hypothetical protein